MFEQGLAVKKKAYFGIHVVPQYTYHADADIVGTREALEHLRNVISEALKFGESEMQTFASDGEGYTLHVKKLPEQQFLSEDPHYVFLNETVRGG